MKKIKLYLYNECIFKLYLKLLLSAFFISLFFFQNSFSQDLIIEEIIFNHKDTKTFEDEVLTDASGLVESEKYNPEMLDEAEVKLKKFYFDNGFFDINVRASAKEKPEEGEIFVTLSITENDRYKVDSLIYNGLNNLEENVAKKIYKIKDIKENDFYNKILIIQLANNILDNLQNNGYMNARIKIDSGTVIKKYNLSAKPVLTVTINFEGADTIYYFGNTGVSIQNNVYNVADDLISKEIEYKEGDIYSKEKKLRSEKNISQISIVQSARIEASSINNNVVQFTVNVNLNKKNEVSPYVKITNIENYFYLGGGVNYLDKYFSRNGRVLLLELDALVNSLKINRFELSATITQPHFFNNRSTLSNKVTAGLYNVEGFKNYLLGNLTTLSYFISDKTFYNTAFLDLNEELVRFNYEFDADTVLNLFHSLLSATIIHDNTNNLLSPSKGFYHSIELGSGGLLPKLVLNAFENNFFYSQYLKLFTFNRFYFNISSFISSTVFATDIKIGDIIEYGSGDKLIPVQPIYKFFSGGSNSLRGWNAKENGVLLDRLAGGNFLLEGSLELRKQLFPRKTNFLKNIGGVVFLDYGNVWESDDDFKFSQIALAIGFGFRYDLVIGPIRVDFGFKLYDPLDTQNEPWLFTNFSRVFSDKFAIQFGIGQSF